MRILTVLAATGAGAAVGWVCGLVPVWPVARLAAAVIGWFVGFVGFVVSLLFTFRGPVAVSVGTIKIVLLQIPAVLLGAVASYFALRWLGRSPASLATSGPIIFGAGAALIAVFWLGR